MAFALVLFSAACTQVSIEEGNGQGYLYVNLERDDSEDLVFKASAEDYTFSLKIYNELSQLVATVDDAESLKEEPLNLNVGKYTVVASTAENSAAAAFDSPFYSGSAEFEVRPDEVSNVDVTCTLANVKVTAKFSDEIKSEFKTYTLTVSNGEGELIFSNTDGTADREGYFSVTGTLTWSLYLENNDGGKYEALTDSYTDVKAKEHYNLSFSLEKQEEFGGGALTIVLDDEMTEKKYDITLDFGDETVPEVSDNFGYVEGEPMEVNAGDNTSKVLSITSEDGFKNLYVVYETESSSAASFLSEARTASNKVQTDLVGASSIDIENLKAAGIVAESVEQGATAATVDITSYIASRPIGTASVSVLSTDINGAYTSKTYEFVLRSPVDVEAVSADAWAMFATVTGKWFTADVPSGLSFQYRKSADADWSSFSGNVTTSAEARIYTAEIRGLEPETEYVFRAISANDTETKEVTFTTEAAGTIHNMSFDEWYQQDGKAWYANASADNFIWDSANEGTANLLIGAVCPTTPSDDVAVPGSVKAASLVSSTAIGQFAAGNIYTGDFVKISGLGAELKWGVPFTSRPVGLKGYFKYNPKKIDKTKSPYGDLSGRPDTCQVQILLTDWSEPFTINTSSNKFVQIDSDPNIIAYGKMEYSPESGSMSGYEEFTILLEYRDMTRIPKYVVITACASKYGDYFTGGVGSTLLVDEFEFVYDPAELE